MQHKKCKQIENEIEDGKKVYWLNKDEWMIGLVKVSKWQKMKEWWAKKEMMQCADVDDGWLKLLLKWEKNMNKIERWVLKKLGWERCDEHKMR